MMRLRTVMLPICSGLNRCGYADTAPPTRRRERESIASAVREDVALSLVQVLTGVTAACQVVMMVRRLWLAASIAALAVAAPAAAERPPAPLLRAESQTAQASSVRMSMVI